MTMRSAARVKLYYGENQYKLNVEAKESYAEFLARVKEITETKHSQTSLTLKYIDDENDPILLTSDEVRFFCGCSWNSSFDKAA